MALQSSSTHRLASYGTSTLTVSKTIAGSDLYLIVKIGHASNADQVTSVTWGGVALTDLKNSGTGGATAIAHIYGGVPAAGTADVVVTASSVYADFAVIIEIWEGISGVGGTTWGGGNAFQSSPRSDAVTIGSGNYATDIIVCGAASTAFTVSGSQTQTQQTGGAPYANRSAGSYLQDATAMAWTWTAGTSHIGHAVVELLASGGGGGSSIVPIASNSYRLRRAA